jgi:DNA-directed RNA polymerase subunit RPC12/RpoP
MKKIEQGNKKKVLWVARCGECDSLFEEEVGKLNITSDQRDGDFAQSKCPDCGCQIFFYPRVSNQWGDH